MSASAIGGALAAGRALACGALAAALVAAACGDSATEPTPTPTTELAVIVNSIDISLTVFAVDSPQAPYTIALAPSGSPVTIAVRGEMAVVPLGIVPAAAVVDLADRRVVRTVGLPEGSGASGVAFLNDSVALIANPGRNSVSPVNVLRGTAGAEIAVGGFPQAVIAVGDTAYVLNSELGPDFQPTGPGTVSVVAGSPPAVVGTITLTGVNPGAAAAGAGATLYVLHSGRFGQADGSLSEVNRGSRAETRLHAGFGDFPGSLAFDAHAGRLYAGSFGYGVAVWDANTAAFTRGPDNPVRPGGIGATAGLGVDSHGRLYALVPECSAPGKVVRLTASFGTELEVQTGTCPFAIAFTAVPPRPPPPGPGLNLYSCYQQTCQHPNEP